MKARFIIAALLAAGSVNFASAATLTSSTALCAATGAGNGTAVTTSATGYLQAGFTPTCSANTHLAAMEDAVQVGVCASSKKGKNYFGGNTNGASPNVSSACPSTGCVAKAATVAGCS
ncbi:hypothetical protein HQ393_16220 [Chitinibacter bivalviorum]|uniref:Uncharacterized protein n=1 Tax=Chitinibacter bivalviorum TaxID=2739434 RepID=A0A7H9BMH0_9NEIS|nr:hypothetical protein [Chitinibacter bivalviorum]QLG89669.1 hypothetical protein HQ393_16220 [Chitinibacter bivalviorum]